MRCFLASFFQELFSVSFFFLLCIAHIIYLESAPSSSLSTKPRCVLHEVATNLYTKIAIYIKLLLALQSNNHNRDRLRLYRSECAICLSWRHEMSCHIVRAKWSFLVYLTNISDLGSATTTIFMHDFFISNIITRDFY